MVDSSGMQIHYTDQLRNYDIGILEVGLEYTDKMAIPPGQEAFDLTGYCISECTRAVSTPSNTALGQIENYGRMRECCR